MVEKIISVVPNSKSELSCSNNYRKGVLRVDLLLKKYKIDAATINKITKYLYIKFSYV